MPDNKITISLLEDEKSCILEIIEKRNKNLSPEDDPWTIQDVICVAMDIGLKKMGKSK